MAIPPESPLATKRVSVGALELAVSEYGDTGAHPSLILLHGIGSRGQSWWPVVENLATYFHLIIPDLRGHGDSDKPERGYLFEHYAADLDSLIKTMSLTAPLIMGHSLGGLTTLFWTADHPDVARGIVLEDTGFRGGPGVAELFDGWIALHEQPVEQVVTYYQQQYPDWSDEDALRRAQSLTQTAPGVFLELRDANRRGDSGDRLESLAVINTPTLLVHGQKDHGSMVVPEDVERFTRAVPGARTVLFPGGGHSLHRDQTAEFLAVVLPFLLNPGGKESRSI